MEMGQKVTDVVRVIKFCLTLIFFTLLTDKSFGQLDSTVFQRNFIRTIHYPEFLKNACMPTFANLLVDVSDKGEIVRLSISDSASKLFRDEFETEKNRLDIQALKNIIDQRKLKDAGLLIPIFYVYGQDYCTNSFADFVSSKYLIFNGKPYNKITYNLEPIFVSFYKPAQ
jgi:hypothetical protein